MDLECLGWREYLVLVLLFRTCSIQSTIVSHCFTTKVEDYDWMSPSVHTLFCTPHLSYLVHFLFDLATYLRVQQQIVIMCCKATFCSSACVCIWETRVMTTSIQLSYSDITGLCPTLSSPPLLHSPAHWAVCWPSSICHHLCIELQGPQPRCWCWCCQMLR